MRTGFGVAVLLAAAWSEAEERPLQTLELKELLELNVASASRKSTTAREAPATVYVVSETMIRERGYDYLYDALRDAPGLGITWMGGLYGPILMPRGLDTPENNKLLVLVDGIVDNNLSAGTAQVYMQYSLHDVKRIEVIYGPASALYGANAMAGLVNIITKAGADLQGLEARAGGILWDPGLRRSGGLGAVAAGKAWGSGKRSVDLAGSFHVVDTAGPDLRLDRSHARSDRPDDPAGASYYFSPDYIGAGEIGTFMAQGRARLQGLGLTAGGHLWRHRGGQGTYGHEGYATLNGLQDKPDTWNFRNATAFVTYQRRLAAKASNTASVVFRDTRLTDGYDLYFTTPGTGPDGPGAPGAAGARYFRPDHSLKLEDAVTWDLSAAMGLTAGVSVEFQRVSDYQLATGHSFDHQRLVTDGARPVLDESRRYSYRIVSGYLEHAWRVWDALALTTGARVDVFHLQGDRTPAFFGTADYDPSGACLARAPACRTLAEAALAGAVELYGVYYNLVPYDDSRTSVNPRLGVVYSALEKKLTLKALYAEGFRMPTVRELFSVTPSRYSNPGLTPEKVRSAELSGTLQVRERGVLELDLFATHGEDVIALSAGTVRRPGRTTSLSQFKNAGKPRIYGSDFKLNLRLADALELFGYYSLLAPRYAESEPSSLSHQSQTADPSDSSLRIPRQATHKGMLGASLRVWDRRLVVSPRINFVGARPGVITSPLQQVPAYASVELALLVRDAGVKGLEAGLSAYNVASADILDPGFRTGNKADDFPAAHPQPGFHALFTLRYRRGF